MMESFISMQDLIKFASAAQGDFSYRWYGLRFTEMILLDQERHHRIYSPVTPQHWNRSDLELVRKPKPSTRKPRP
jgi:hypothetical protein